MDEPKRFKRMLNLKAINLSNNFITNMEPKALNGLSNLNEIILDYNRISCITYIGTPYLLVMELEIDIGTPIKGISNTQQKYQNTKNWCFKYLEKIPKYLTFILKNSQNSKYWVIKQNLNIFY